MGNENEEVASEGAKWEGGRENDKETVNMEDGGDKMAAWTRAAMGKKKKWGCIRLKKKKKNLEAEPRD